MPLLKISDVLSFSSEDSAHVAENVKLSDPTKKWKCQKAGEPSASVILKLDKASVISSIDIGNEGSAYVEILVNRTESNADYKVLLMMSSFMTPVEARQGSNLNKVRMFKSDDLSKPECTEKWDKIKIVCTQPFNRLIQYGLSFIKFYSSEDKKVDTPQAGLGKFTLRPSSPENGLQIGSLFARRKELQNEPTAAVAIRAAAASPLNITKPSFSSAESLKRKKLCDNSPKPKKANIEDLNCSRERNRYDLLYKDDEDKLNDKMEKAMQKRDKEKEELKAQKELEKKKKEKTQKEYKTKTTDKEDNSQVTIKKTPNKKPKVEERKDTKPVRIKRNMKDYNKLLEGVVIVISGIQNPERANIRTAALQMGAKYKPDWENSCTHLICAFQNTPKFNQVKGKGKIVTKKWVLDCSSNRKRLPWRRYALDPDDKKQPESEDEIWETQEDNDEELPSTSSASKNSPDNTETQNNSDTEDEIERLQARQKVEVSESGEETEDEVVNKVRTNNPTPDLGNFFQGELFYIDDEIPEDTKVLLNRYIVAFEGTVNTAFTKDVTIVLSTDETCSVLKVINPNIPFLSPAWVWKCHNKQRRVDFDTYLL